MLSLEATPRVLRRLERSRWVRHVEEDRLHARRLVHRDIRDPKIVKKLFDTLGARYTERPGGYTRILKLGPRGGDGAEMAIVELLGSEFKPKKKDEKEAKKKGDKA